MRDARVALAGLTPEEADRVAARERVPAIVALGLASHLAGTGETERSVRRIDGWTGTAHRADRSTVLAWSPGMVSWLTTTPRSARIVSTSRRLRLKQW
jgi:hypothetical protein